MNSIPELSGELLALRPLVINWARHYTLDYELQEDLIQEAMIAAWKASQRLDRGRPKREQTAFLRSHARGAMRHFIADVASTYGVTRIPARPQKLFLRQADLSETDEVLWLQARAPEFIESALTRVDLAAAIAGLRPNERRTLAALAAGTTWRRMRPGDRNRLPQLRRKLQVALAA